MATAVADRIWRRSAPESVEHDLAALWSEVGRAAPTARAVMSNLVVVCPASVESVESADSPWSPWSRWSMTGQTTEFNDAPADIAGFPVEEVSQRHPARVIVLHHARSERPCGPADAAVGVYTFGPPHARFGVEHIAIRSACPDESLPSIVRRLTIGDLPTSIWWADDMSRAAPVPSLVSAGQQLLYDSRSWKDVRDGVLALAALVRGSRAPNLVDVNWRRLLPLRQALVAAMSSRGLEGLRTIDVRHRAEDAALAWLLVGWLAARGVISSVSDQPLVEPSDADETLTVSFRGASLEAAMNDARVVIHHGPKRAPLILGVPQESAAAAIAAELRTLHRDTCLHDSLAALVHFFGRTASG